MTGGFRVSDALKVAFVWAILSQMARITATKTVPRITLTITTSQEWCAFLGRLSSLPFHFSLSISLATVTLPLGCLTLAAFASI